MTHYATHVPERDSRAGERRAARRQRALKGARLVFNCGQSVADAVVRDVSEAGVRLRLGDTVGIPRDCMVAMTGSERMRPGRVVWRTSTEMGLSLR
ncbi:MAG: hypothetical protein BroJett030_08860 [Alphaproteobacteria bacterium]|nr:MAG: hypothetical protein BroJett030_08860 [Alphaproteobacteria bacterium]